MRGSPAHNIIRLNVMAMSVHARPRAEPVTFDAKEGDVETNGATNTSADLSDDGVSAEAIESSGGIVAVDTTAAPQ